MINAVKWNVKSFNYFGDGIRIGFVADVVISNTNLNEYFRMKIWRILYSAYGLRSSNNAPLNKNCNAISAHIALGYFTIILCVDLVKYVAGGGDLIFPNPLSWVCHMDFSSHGRHYLIRCNNMRHHVRVTRYADGNELQDAPRRVSTTRGRGPGKVVEKGQMGWSVGAGEGPLSWNRSFSVGGKWSQKCKITL